MLKVIRSLLLKIVDDIDTGNSNITGCKISLNHSKSNLLKINDEVGSIRYWALKIGKAHSVLSYRLKVHGIDNLRKYIEQRIKLV